MNKLLENFDWSILICVLILCGFGGATLASVAIDVLPAQVVFYVVGLALFFLFSIFDYKIFLSLGKPLYLGSLFLLIFTLFLGFESRGAVRWISLGSFRLQFSEVLKPFLIVAFAALIQGTNKSRLSGFLFSAALALVPVVLIFKQPDFGSSIVYFASFVVMFFVSGANLLYILASLVFSLVSIPIVWHFLADYQKRRIATFLSPGYDPLGASYNAIQSVITVGSGMFLGRGLGRGTQSHLLFLPEHHTDFIFASTAEELGFLGAGTVLVVYFFLIWRVFTVALKCPDRFGSLVACGIGSLLLFQGGINIGMNLGLLPVTGVPLPLLSYGGSSMLATMIALGIVENIARHQNSPEIV